jgi:hypothetical protein
MPVKHKKLFGIYHWDTFDNETLLVGEADTAEEAERMVMAKYKNRISSAGADQVEIVSRTGDILKSWKIK